MKFKIFATLAFVITILNSFAQNVGIGTTTPQARLHVADSNVYFSSPSSTTGLETTPTENGGKGLLWIAGKSALRVGVELGDRWAYDNVGAWSASFGFNNRVKGVGSFASGLENSVSTNYSVALGSYNFAKNIRTLAFGNYSEALGDYSNAIGYGVAAQAYQSTAVGRFNKLAGNATSDLLTDPIFVIGNGTSDVYRSNALTFLKNGNIGIGTMDPTSTKMEVYTTDLETAITVSNLNNGAKAVGIDATTRAASGYAIVGRALGTGSGYGIPLTKPAGIVGYAQGDNTGVAGFSYSGTAVRALSYTGDALYTSGNIALTGIGEGVGKILMSDNLGNGSWRNPSTLTLDNALATGISQFEFRNNGAYRGAFGWSQADGRFFFYDGESGTNTMFINNGRMGIRRDATTNALEVGGEASKSTAGSWLGNSDARLKKNIVPVTNALNKLLQLNGIQYEWNDNQTGYPRPAGIQMGFTAQNVQQVFPEKVSTDSQGFLQTAYGTYDPLIVEAIRELKNENDVLKKEIAEIKKLLEKK